MFITVNNKNDKIIAKAIKVYKTGLSLQKGALKEISSILIRSKIIVYLYIGLLAIKSP